MGLISLLFLILPLVANWFIYKKAGEPGWAAIVPLYNTYVLFKIIYGNGWKCLWLLVPFVNIYYAFTMYFKLAKVFGQGFGFGLGLFFLNPIFLLILAFGDFNYLGSLKPVTEADLNKTLAE